MKRILDNLPLILLGLVVIGVVIVLSPILIVGLLIFAIHKYIQSKKGNKIFNQFLRQNQGKMLFCYTTKKNYKVIFNQHILPQLNPDIIPIFYQGGKVQNHKDWMMLEYIIKSMNEGKGYPKIFYFDKKGVSAQSFSDTYKYLISDEGNYSRFVEIVHQTFKSFGATFSEPHPTIPALEEPKLDALPDISLLLNLESEPEPEPEPEEPKSKPLPPNFRRSA